jgi:hypothetical protein
MASLINRNGVYYIQWYSGRKIRRRSLGTDSLQLAKDKLRQFESAQLRGLESPLPTRTPLPDILILTYRRTCGLPWNDAGAGVCPR